MRHALSTVAPDRDQPGLDVKHEIHAPSTKITRHPAQRVRVGIVMPAYKVERFLAESLNSLLAQTFADWHCVIVDDASPDGTFALASKFAEADARFTLVRQEHAGVSAARNRGFAALPDDITHVTFMDSDDVYLPHALETLVDACLQNPSAIGAHGIADTIDEHSRELNPGVYAAYCRDRLGFLDGRVQRFPDHLPTCFESLLFVAKVVPPGVALIQKEAYRQAGAWDPSLIFCQDWDMIIRVSRFGSIHYLPEVILQYRRHANNASSRKRSHLMMRKVYHKTYFSPANSPLQKRTLKRAWRAWQRYRICHKIAEMRQLVVPFRPIGLALRLAHVGIHAIRYVRGFPTASGW